MNIQYKEAANGIQQPENYRNPGNPIAANDLEPSTRELLSILSNLEGRIAA